MIACVRLPYFTAETLRREHRLPAEQPVVAAEAKPVIAKPAPAKAKKPAAPAKPAATAKSAAAPAKGAGDGKADLHARLLGDPRDHLAHVSTLELRGVDRGPTAGLPEAPRVPGEHVVPGLPERTDAEG